MLALLVFSELREAEFANDSEAVRYAAVLSSLSHLVLHASGPHSLGTTQWRCRKQREKGWGKPVLP